MVARVPRSVDRRRAAGANDEDLLGLLFAQVLGQPPMEIVDIRSTGELRPFELNLVQGLARPGNEGCCRTRSTAESPVTDLRADHVAVCIRYDCEFPKHQKVPIATLKAIGFGSLFVI